MKWNQIDFSQKTLTITDTKNHQQHILPLSDFLYNVLHQCKQTATSIYVFPGSESSGYLIEPRKQMRKVTE